ncbi:ASP-1 protein [Aphelenchoides avenae]|nr:ASP-1 protein [Aphelenchus avenae]
MLRLKSAVVLDTGSSNLFVFDCNATSGYKKQCYKPQNSTTYAANGAPFSTQYSLEIAHGHVSSYLVADVVDFGGDIVDVNQTFGIATTDSGYFAKGQPVDGIFGLGWPSGSDDNPFRPPLFQILDQLDKPLFTIWLDG